MQILIYISALYLRYPILGQPWELFTPPTMVYGRKHCNDISPYLTRENNSFAEAQKGLADTLSSFSSNFGLTDRETVALLGNWNKEKRRRVLVCKKQLSSRE